MPRQVELQMAGCSSSMHCDLCLGSEKFPRSLIWVGPSSDGMNNSPQPLRMVYYNHRKWHRKNESVLRVFSIYRKKINKQPESKGKHGQNLKFW